MAEQNNAPAANIHLPDDANRNNDNVQRPPSSQPAHEIPTSDNDQGSTSFDYDPRHIHHNTTDGLPPPPPPSLYSPHPPFPPPMHCPPMLLPPPPVATTVVNNNNSQQLDFTRQYYEARMREHAMQYANAAAGAAWAASRLADSFLQNNTNNSNSYDGGDPSWQYYYQGFPTECGVLPPGTAAANHLQRTLWEPNDNRSKSEGRSNNSKWKQSTNHSHDEGGGGTSHRPQQQQRSKKRESGNDSISSLGSESYHHSQRQHSSNSHHSGGGGGSSTNNYQSKKKKKGKKNQRRRFNNDDDEPEQDDTRAITQDYKRPNNTDGTNHVNAYQHRQKRGLQQQPSQLSSQQGQSSKNSFSSSHGSSGNNNASGSNNHHHHGGNNRKKKNRSTSLLPSIHNSTNNNTFQGVFLGGLIGKTGVSALHELCHKYRWEKPVYTLIETDAAIASSSNNANDGIGARRKDDGQDDTNNGITNNNLNRIIQVHPHEFVLAVHVNKIELGRGRGDSKTAAKQDGSRKALAALVPGVVFDPNGILLDVGGGGGGSGSGRGRGHTDRLSGSSDGNIITSMEELGPHLASQLAIGGNDTTPNNNPDGHHLLRSSRPSSPDHSETSSISTSVSMTKMARVGNASSIIDNVGIGEGGGMIIGRYSSNIYPCASTTSGVSSASEVEDGEDENAYYASRGASVCSTLLQAMWQIDDRIRQPPSYAFDVYPIPSARESSSGGGTEQPNKKRKSGGPPVERKKPTTHRGTFQCTATLNLYFRMEDVKDKSPSSLMESWESPLEYLQTREAKISSSYYPNAPSLQESRKRKDSFASQATPSPDRHRHRKDAGDNDDDDDHNEPDHSTSKRQKVDEFAKHTIESIATGSTKRESKHKASAKLLTLLFPECTSLVEVKASAEAARECYAATKAMSSQTKRAKLSNKSSPERGDPILERSSTHLAKSDSFVSVAGLSLSEEPVDESKHITWCDSTKRDAEISFQCKVDSALQCLREQEEEPSVDVGRIVLCRARPDDAEFIYALLNKGTESNRVSGEVANEVPSQDVGVESGVEEASDSIVGSDSTIYLLLSRAVSSHEPLGCAILTFATSTAAADGEERELVLQNIGHEEHLPRERFIECLEAFASKMETNLDTDNILNETNLASTVEIRQCLNQQQVSSNTTPSYQDQEVISMKSNSSHHSLLQSVKEEDSEDADDCSDGDAVEKEVDVTQNSGKRMRSKRRREIHDRQKH